LGFGTLVVRRGPAVSITLLETTMLQPWCAKFCVRLSVITTVKLSVPLAVGVPLTNPLELKLSGESEPPAKPQEYDPLPLEPRSWDE
jgi:hypothetical protein